MMEPVQQQDRMDVIRHDHVGIELDAAVKFVDTPKGFSDDETDSPEVNRSVFDATEQASILTRAHGHDVGARRRVVEAPQS
jgi:hypothetical protein